MNKDKKHTGIMGEDDLNDHQLSRPTIVGRTNMVHDPLSASDNHKSNQPETKQHKEMNIPTPSSSGAQNQQPEITKDIHQNQKVGISSPANDDSGSKIDDSIVDSNVPSPPNMSVNNSTQQLIKQKTYFLPIRSHATQSKLGLVVYVLLTVIVISGALCVIIL